MMSGSSAPPRPGRFEAGSQAEELRFVTELRNELHSDRQPRAALVQRQRDCRMAGAVEKRREGFDRRQMIEKVAYGCIRDIDVVGLDRQRQASVGGGQKHVISAEKMR